MHSPTTPSTQPRARLVILAAIAVSLAGMAALLLMTRWSIGTSPDSAHYIGDARQLVDRIRGDAGAAPGQGSAQFAPLYTWALAAMGTFGVDPIDTARALNVVLFGLNIFLVGFVIRRSTRDSSWFWLAGSLLMLGATPVLSAHAVAQSEPLFLFFSLLGLCLLAMYLERDSAALLLAAAAAIAMAFLTRYAGAAWILTGTMAVFLWSRAPLARRVREALLFGALSALPMAIWILKNASVGSATGRELVFHPVGTSHVWQAIYTASAWVFIPSTAPNVLRLLMVAALALALAVIIVRRTVGMTVGPTILPMLALLIVTYGAFLVVSISFLDANTPLDDRILLPVFVAGMIVILGLLDEAWPFVLGHRATASLVLAGLTAFLAVHLLNGSRVIAASYEDGWGFTGRAWQGSATVGQVKKLPEETVVYSNAPALVYLQTGRVAAAIPAKVLLMQRRANPEFPLQMAAMKERLKSTCGVVVYFRGLGDQKSLPAEQELRTLLSLVARSDERDGAILSTATCQR